MSRLRLLSAQAAAEPYRWFFPAGILFGAIGISLWPLYFAEYLATYPATAHARLLVEGLMAAFIFGFLGTAAPRLLEAAPFARWETGLLLGLQAGTCSLHLGSRVAGGDALFAATLGFFLAVLGRRFRARRDLPPPPFVLVGAGLACGLAGSLLLTWSEVQGGWPRLARLGATLLQQGFVLFPVLGTGAFLLRRFLGLRPAAEHPSQPSPTARWRNQALLLAGLVVVILGTFLLELFLWPRLAGVLRTLALLAYLAIATPFFARGGGNFLAHTFRLGLACVTLAPLWLVFLPSKPVAGLHVLFVGGFNVLVFVVGTRVIYGHAGQAHRFGGRISWLAWAVGLLLFALLTRLGADFGSTRGEHLILAAAIWLGAAALWAGRLLPWVGESEDDE